MNKFRLLFVFILIFSLAASYYAVTVLGTEMVFLLAIIFIVGGVLIFYISLKKKKREYHLNNIKRNEDKLRSIEDDFNKGLIGELEYQHEKEILEVQIELEKNKEW